MGITTHVLDIAMGRPAAGVPVRLELQSGSGWVIVGEGATDADGRQRGLLGDTPMAIGTYRITFDTAHYLHALNIEAFFPEATIVFSVRDTSQHYHVPLLLSPFGYSTYRGS